jgi:hypothetical protein
MASGPDLVGVEIKSSMTFHQDFLKGLKHIQHVFKKKTVRAIVVYAGTEAQSGDEFSLLNYQDMVSIFRNQSQ